MALDREWDREAILAYARGGIRGRISRRGSWVCTKRFWDEIMMKIALITNYWKNSDSGGIKTYLVNLVDALQDKGGDVSVLFREGDDPEHFCGGKNKVAFSFACYRRLRKSPP